MIRFIAFWNHRQGQKKVRGPIRISPQPSALSTVAHVGAQVAPQRCPILRMNVAIVSRGSDGGRFFVMKRVHFRYDFLMCKSFNWVHFRY